MADKAEDGVGHCGAAGDVFLRDGLYPWREFATRSAVQASLCHARPTRGLAKRVAVALEKTLAARRGEPLSETDLQYWLAEFAQTTNGPGYLEFFRPQHTMSTTSATALPQRPSYSLAIVEANRQMSLYDVQTGRSGLPLTTRALDVLPDGMIYLCQLGLYCLWTSGESRIVVLTDELAPVATIATRIETRKLVAIGAGCNVLSLGVQHITLYAVHLGMRESALRVKFRQQLVIEVAQTGDDCLVDCFVDTRRNVVGVALRQHVCLYDLATGRAAQPPTRLSIGRISCMAFSDAWQYIFCGSTSGRVAVCDSFCNVLHVFRHSSQPVIGITPCAASAASVCISHGTAALHFDNLLHFSESHTHEAPDRVQRYQAFDEHLSVLETAHSVAIVARRRIVQFLARFDAGVRALALGIAPNRAARALAVIDDDVVHFLCPRTGTTINYQLPYFDLHGVRQFAYSRALDRLLVLLRTGDIWLMTTDSNPCIAMDIWLAPPSPGNRPQHLVFFETPFAVMLFAGTLAGEVVLYDRYGAAALRTQAHREGVHLLAASPSAGLLVSATKDGELCAMRVSGHADGTGVVSVAIVGHTHLPAAPASLALSNTHLSVAFVDGAVSTFDVNLSTPGETFHALPLHLRTFDHNDTLRGHATLPAALGFATSGGHDRLVKVWNCHNGLVREIDTGLAADCLAAASVSAGDLLLSSGDRLFRIEEAAWRPAGVPPTAPALEPPAETPLPAVMMISDWDRLLQQALVRQWIQEQPPPRCHSALVRVNLSAMTDWRRGAPESIFDTDEGRAFQALHSISGSAAPGTAVPEQLMSTAMKEIKARLCVLRDLHLVFVQQLAANHDISQLASVRVAFSRGEHSSGGLFEPPSPVLRRRRVPRASDASDVVENVAVVESIGPSEVLPAAVEVIPAESEHAEDQVSVAEPSNEPAPRAAAAKAKAPVAPAASKPRGKRALVNPTVSAGNGGGSRERTRKAAAAAAIAGAVPNTAQFTSKLGVDAAPLKNAPRPQKVVPAKMPPEEEPELQASFDSDRMQRKEKLLAAIQRPSSRAVATAPDTAPESEESPAAGSVHDSESDDDSATDEHVDTACEGAANDDESLQMEATHLDIERESDAATTTLTGAPNTSDTSNDHQTDHASVPQVTIVAPEDTQPLETPQKLADIIDENLEMLTELRTVEAMLSGKQTRRSSSAGLPAVDEHTTGKNGRVGGLFPLPLIVRHVASRPWFPRARFFRQRGEHDTDANLVETSLGLVISDCSPQSVVEALAERMLAQGRQTPLTVEEREEVFEYLFWLEYQFELADTRTLQELLFQTLLSNVYGAGMSRGEQRLRAALLDQFLQFSQSPLRVIAILLVYCISPFVTLREKSLDLLRGLGVRRACSDALYQQVAQLLATAGDQSAPPAPGLPPELVAREVAFLERIYQSDAAGADPPRAPSTLRLYRAPAADEDEASIADATRTLVQLERTYAPLVPLVRLAPNAGPDAIFAAMRGLAALAWGTFQATSNRRTDSPRGSMTNLASQRQSRQQSLRMWRSSGSLSRLRPTPNGTARGSVDALAPSPKSRSKLARKTPSALEIAPEEIRPDDVFNAKTLQLLQQEMRELLALGWRPGTSSEKRMAEALLEVEAATLAPSPGFRGALANNDDIGVDAPADDPSAVPAATASSEQLHQAQFRVLIQLYRRHRLVVSNWDAPESVGDLGLRSPPQTPAATVDHASLQELVCCVNHYIVSAEKRLLVQHYSQRIDGYTEAENQRSAQAAAAARELAAEQKKRNLQMYREYQQRAAQVKDDLGRKTAAQSRRRDSVAGQSRRSSVAAGPPPPSHGPSNRARRGTMASSQRPVVHGGASPGASLVHTRDEGQPAASVVRGSSASPLVGFEGDAAAVRPSVEGVVETRPNVKSGAALPVVEVDGAAVQDTVPEPAALELDESSSGRQLQLAQDASLGQTPDNPQDLPVAADDVLVGNSGIQDATVRITLPESAAPVPDGPTHQHTQDAAERQETPLPAANEEQRLQRRPKTSWDNRKESSPEEAAEQARCKTARDRRLAAAEVALFALLRSPGTPTNGGNSAASVAEKPANPTRVAAQRARSAFPRRVVPMRAAVDCQSTAKLAATADPRPWSSRFAQRGAADAPSTQKASIAAAMRQSLGRPPVAQDDSAYFYSLAMRDDADQVERLVQKEYEAIARHGRTLDSTAPAPAADSRPDPPLLEFRYAAPHRFYRPSA